MGSPISPLGNVTNPLGSVIDGLLTGHNLGLQMQQMQMQEQEFQKSQTMRDQQIQSNDNTARQNLLSNSRQVNSAGMVQVPSTDPRAMAGTGTAAQGGADAGPAQRPTLQSPPSTEAPIEDPLVTNLGQMPGSDPYTVQPPAQAPTPQAPAQPAGGNPSRLPQADPIQLPNSAGATQGNVWVKADPARLVKYKDSRGNIFQGELYTPQEQAERTLAAETAKLHVGQTKISMSPEDATKMGLASPDAWIPNADLNAYMKQRSDDEQIPAPPGYPQKTIARKDYAAALKQGEEGRHNLADEGNTQAGQDNQAQIAEDNRKSREAAAKISADAKLAASTERNKTVLQAAGIRAATKAGAGGRLTPNAAGVAGRFDQREIDADTKTMEAAQTAEQAAHAKLSDIGAATGTEDGETFNDPLSTSGKELTMNAIQRARLKAAYDQQSALATQKAAAQKSIRQKHQWGEFAPGATPPAAPGAAAPAATPPAAAPPAAKPALPAPSPTPGRIRVQITTPDGKVHFGAVDKAQFDAKTMKQL